MTKKYMVTTTGDRQIVEGFSIDSAIHNYEKDANNDDEITGVVLFDESSVKNLRIEKVLQSEDLPEFQQSIDNMSQESKDKVDNAMKRAEINAIINKHCIFSKDDLRFASVKYFAESGSLSGALHEAIGKCMEEYAKIFDTPPHQVQGKEVQTAEDYDTIPPQFVGDKSRKIKRVTATTYPKEKYFAVEYAGFWNIQNGQYYGDDNILDADKVGEDTAERNAKLIAKLLNNHFNASQFKTTLTQEGQELYRWVKASERLPKNDWYGVVKWTDSADWANFAGNFYEGNICSHGKQYHNQPFEWLEKIPSEQLYSRT